MIKTNKMFSKFLITALISGLVISNAIPITSNSVKVAEVTIYNDHYLNLGINSHEVSVSNDTVYVDDDAPESWYDEYHVRTIQEGVDKAAPGYTVFVYNGTYTNNGWAIILDTLENLILMGEDTNSTIIEAYGHGSGFFLENSKKISINGFTVNHTGPLADHIGIRLVNCHKCTISNCIVKNAMAWGIAIEQSFFNTIKNCYVNNCTWDGITICLSSQNNTVMNCLVNSTKAISIAQNSCGNILRNNTVSNNRRAGVNIGASSINNTIYNNNFIGNYVDMSEYFDIELFRLFRFPLNAIDLCSGNYWDNGSIGNYWDSYIGGKIPWIYDQDGDGIGNMPHWIPLHGIDRYPLMSPHGSQIKQKHVDQEFNTIQCSQSSSNVTIFVDDDNTQGPWDGSKQHPYQHIQNAVDNATDGDTIRVYEGIYPENIQVEKKLNILGNGSMFTKIDGIDGTSVTIREDSVKINGFKICNGTRGIKIISNSNYISKNNISAINGDGIWLLDSSRNIIANNTISNNNKHGIWMVNSDNTTVKDNTIIANYLIGIMMESSHRNIVSNNSLAENAGEGIHFDKSSNNIISGNKISNNGHSNVGLNGISLNYHSNNNLIKSNVVLYNKGFGIHIQDDSNGNIIYLNNFTGSEMPLLRKNAWDECTNTWDNGSTGNYWNDYWGRDSNNDGIGDIPYPIPPYKYGNADRYPVAISRIYNDSTPPSIDIEKPRHGWLYIFNHKIWPTLKGKTIILSIINGIDITALVRDNQSGVYNVSFYINGELKDIELFDPPEQITYIWSWDDTVLDGHQITIKAGDMVGNINSVTMDVTIINFELPSPPLSSFYRIIDKLPRQLNLICGEEL